MKISLNDSKTYNRCLREIRNSTGSRMLRTALTYASLFVRKLERQKTDTTDVLDCINKQRKKTKNRLGL